MATTTEDVVVSPLIQALLNKLVSNWMLKFGSEWGVKKELRNLFKTLKLAYVMTSSTEDMQASDPLLKILLRDMREVVYRATYTLDEFIYEAQRQSLEEEQDDDDESKESSSRASVKVRQYFSFSFNEKQILYGLEIPTVITGIINELHEMQQKMNHNYVTSVSSLGRNLNTMERKLKTISLLDSRPQSVSLLNDSETILGRREDADGIINLLLSDEYNGKGAPVVSIVGIGGIGKTMLAQLIYNDGNVVNHFEVRAWVCVSEDYDVIQITRAILESITCEKQQDMNKLEPLQSKLKNSLQGKKFLLVLDDIWNDDPKTWDAVRVPINAAAGKGSRIIVTTRLNKISSIMSAMRKFDLEGLPYELGWELFKRKAFVDDEICNAHPNLKKIGGKIVEKCKGLPLAIKSLGGLLYGDLDVKKWKFVLESEMWEVGDDTIMSTLRLSYYHLPAHLKLCFAYCSLFPKEHKFDKKTLVRLWMAEGFISSKEIDTMEDLGGQYFDELLNRSFFQKYEEEIVMHDLMHDLAESVSKDMYLRVEKGKPNNSCSIPEEVRYVSMIAAQLDFMVAELYKYKDSSTLVLSKSSYSGLHLPHDFFEPYRCLRVLDMSGKYYRFRVLPDSIGKLKHLRLLNLNETGIKVFPESLCNLYNLQTLMLKDCKINGFPKNMGSLINLQHIEMYDNEMWRKFNLIRGIGKLRFLKTLPKFRVRKINGNNSTIGELKELCHLQGSIFISGLENVVDSEQAKEANLFNKHQIDELMLEWSHSNGERGGVEGILEGLQPYTGLKALQIWNYGGICFPQWMMSGLACYDMLISVELWNCSNCKFLPPLGNLPVLKRLHIVGIKEVEYMSREFYGCSSDNNNYNKGFQMLEILNLWDMSGLKEWWGTEEGEFPQLKKLTLHSCPKLTKLPPLLLIVKEIEIERCEMLSSLPRLPSASALEVSNCDEKILNWTHECPSLSNLNIGNFPNMTSMPSEMLQSFAQKLKYLVIFECPMLQSVPKLEGLVSLQYLKIYRCPMLQSLPNLQGLTSLQFLQIYDCYMLGSLPQLHCLAPLQHLEINNCSILQTLPELQGLTSVQHLKISVCPMLHSFPKLQGLTSLQNLHISECRMLQSIQELQDLASLRHLEINKCPMLQLLPELQGLTSLLSLHIQECTMLQSLPDFQDLASLRQLKLRECPNLTSLPKGLHKLNSLQELSIWWSNCMKPLLEEKLPISLRCLNIDNCPRELKNRLREGGEDWPKISHIPTVHLIPPLLMK